MDSFRGGGDLWDNPRYRAAFAGLQAGVVAWTWLEQRRTCDPWLRRALIAAAAIVAWFLPWYWRRYSAFTWPVVDLFKTIGLGVASAVLLNLWDWARKAAVRLPDPLDVLLARGGRGRRRAQGRARGAASRRHSGEDHGLGRRRLADERRGKVLREQPGAMVVVAYPVQVEGQTRGAVVLDVADRPRVPLRAVLRQLQWGVGWLEALLLRRQHADDLQRVQRVRIALDVLAVAAEHARLDARAMAVGNDLATRFGCDRVALGVDRGGRARLLAL